MKKSLFCFILIIGFILFASIKWKINADLCDPTLPIIPFDYENPTIPNHILNDTLGFSYDNMPPSNPITNEGATLGRVLFYDKQLSINNTISCASCHLQEFAFTDTARFSIGFDGGLTPRNSMSLVNFRFIKDGKAFWDERSPSLEHQVLQPIQDNVEMGMMLNDLVLKLENSTYYPNLFQEAYGTNEINPDRIAKALAQFVRSIISFDSRYDQGRATTPRDQEFPNFSTAENRGKALFTTHCQNAGCHSHETFVNEEPMNIGLDSITIDAGLGGVTGNPMDNGKFRSPMLRNIDKTGPYMHDGRFPFLNAVVTFYDHGIKAHPNLHPELIDSTLWSGPPQLPVPQDLELSVAQINNLIAFLRTLTDNTVLNEVKWSDPFECNNPVSTFEPQPNIPLAKVFPNKTQDYIWCQSIKKPIQEIAIYSNTGKQLQYVQSINKMEYQLDLSNWPTGFYFIRIKINQKITTEKVFKI